MPNTGETSITAADIFAPKTNFAVSSTQFCQCTFDESYIREDLGSGELSSGEICRCELARFAIQFDGFSVDILCRLLFPFCNEKAVEGQGLWIISSQKGFGARSNTRKFI